MTAQAGLPRSVVMTGSLTFAAVVATCISMMTATAQSSLPDYTAIIAAPDRTEAACRPTSGATPSSCWHSLALARA
jgi:hypothetical protein